MLSQTLHDLGKNNEISLEVFLGNYNNTLSAFDDHKKIFTDGSKDGSKVSAAAVCDGRVFLSRLPDNASIFTAELRAILLAINLINTSSSKAFVILVDSLSSIQAIENRNWSHPVVQEILIKLHHLIASGSSITFMWIPSHIGIKGNTLADTAAKLALSSSISD